MEEQTEEQFRRHIGTELLMCQLAQKFTSDEIRFYNFDKVKAILEEIYLEHVYQVAPQAAILMYPKIIDAIRKQVSLTDLIPRVPNRGAIAPHKYINFIEYCDPDKTRFYMTIGNKAPWESLHIRLPHKIWRFLIKCQQS